MTGSPGMQLQLYFLHPYYRVGARQVVGRESGISRIARDLYDYHDVAMLCTVLQTQGLALERYKRSFFAERYSLWVSYMDYPS